ncbi:hypothetical protein A6R68_22064 [Neotoma lepida]|uniref:glyceraldehyde-3-phosphate dehydrogenase (phosphorylating) n=1 Tax=Neotoma lepida TaxID=56216 RepID=A0A1A6HNA8_NEOLE|nr:hypothetical protein A6R68_22064 [Neotoma lepida]
MVKIGLNRLAHMGHLVIRASFNAGKVDTVAINDSFLDFNYIVHMLQNDSIYGKFHGTVKAENRKFVINGKTIIIFQELSTGASCTNNCLATLTNVIHDNFGIVEGLMTIVHAITATQKTVNDPFGKLWCDGHKPAQNIILDNFVKLMSWYDNDYGYGNRVVDLMAYT